MESPEGIKAASVQHFEDRFTETQTNRPKFKAKLFRLVSIEDANWHESSISMEADTNAVMEGKGMKSPGFNFSFIKIFWSLLKQDFFNCVKHFDVTGRLAKGCNPSFIVLVPKKLDPLE